MHNTKYRKQYALVGDEFADCTIALFADADFAGDKSDSISTSGVFAAVVGPMTYVPILLSVRSKLARVIQHVKLTLSPRMLD